MIKSALHLAKENFKFSSAHFLIFDETSAEMLHGHNYKVRVDLECPLNFEKGYAVDFSILKKYIKAQVDLWDEHILLPAKHPDMKYTLSEDKKNYNIHFRDRFYSFPVNETIWLPITNTSVEQLSLLLAQNFYNEFKKYNIIQLQVFVEETSGQSASALVSA